MKLTFEADVDGQPKRVQMRFGNERDLAELCRWRSPARLRANPQLRAAIHRNPRAELAFMLIARASWQPDPKLLGLAYCRRSWCHRLIVDFVAVHPHVVGRLRENIRDMGTGLFNGLIQIADDLGIKMIWGEATVNSAPFYERILGAKPVLDPFHLQGEAMEHCRRELARIHQPRT